MPSASAPFVCAPSNRSRIDEIRPAIQTCAPALPRPPLPAPTFVTMANAPLPGRDGKPHRLICISENQNYFCMRGWTGLITLICLDKSDFSRKPAARWRRRVEAARPGKSVQGRCPEGAQPVAKPLRLCSCFRCRGIANVPHLLPARPGRNWTRLGHRVASPCLRN